MDLVAVKVEPGDSCKREPPTHIYEVAIEVEPRKPMDKWYEIPVKQELCDEEYEETPSRIRDGACPLETQAVKQEVDTLPTQVHQPQRDIDCGMSSGPVAAVNEAKEASHIEAQVNEDTASLENNKDFVCSICSKRYKEKRYLKKHMTNHVNSKPYECQLCKKRFRSQNHLKVHMPVHRDEKHFVCTICSEAFNCNIQLKGHMLEHTIVRPHTCAVCNKRYIDASALRVHMTSHTGEKPCKCSVCDESFKTLNELNDHVFSSHVAGKPDECSVCGKRFTRRSYLVVHMRLHTGENPYECRVCNRKFISSCSLSKHVYRTHTLKCN